MSKKRHAFILIFLVALSCYNVVLPVFRKELQTYFSLNLDHFGLLLSTGLAVGAVSSLVGGILIERKSLSSILRWTLIGMICGMCIIAAAKTIAVMVAGLVVSYAFSYPFYIAVQTHLVQTFPGHRTRAISLNMVAIGMAGALFPLMAEWLLKYSRNNPAVSFGMVLHLPYLAIAAVMFLGVFLWAGNDPVDTGHKGSTTSAGPKQALGTATILLIVLTVLHAAGDNAAAVWIPRVLDSRSFSVHTVAPGIIVSAYSVAYVVSRLIMVALPPGFGSRAMMVFPGIIGGSIFLAGILSHSQAVTGLAYVLGGFIWSVEYPVMMAAIAETVGGSFSRAMAISLVGSGMAAFLLSYLLGLAGSTLGENRLWLVLIPSACCYILVGLGGMLWVTRYGPAERPD